MTNESGSKPNFGGLEVAAFESRRAEEIAKLISRCGGVPRVVATGGLAARIASETKSIERVEPFLTLQGLRLLFEKNRSDGSRKER